MKKILVAIKNDFIRGAYVEIFRREELEVFETKNGKGALDLIKKVRPDIALVDVFLPEMGGFKILEELKKEGLTKEIPVVIFDQLEKKQDRERAMNLEAKDFVAAANTTPAEITRRIKIILGEQKSYRIDISKNLEQFEELMKDLDLDPKGKCQKCGAKLTLYLVRDLSAGENHFIVSFICPNCG